MVRAWEARRACASRVHLGVALLSRSRPGVSHGEAAPRGPGAGDARPSDARARGAPARPKTVRDGPRGPPGYGTRPGARTPPPPLGHHALTSRFQNAERLAGGRPAGASREEIAPKLAHWAKETAYEIYADSETLDGSLSAAAEARRRSRETTESSRRFAAPPRDHEPRVALLHCHPRTPPWSSSTATGLFRARTRRRGGRREPRGDAGRRAPVPAAAKRRAHRRGRPFRGDARLREHEHYARDTALETLEDATRVSGAGVCATRVTGFHPITGAAAAASRAAGYERHGALSSVPSSDSRCAVRAENGDPLLRMRPARPPGSDPAAYDIVTGAARAAAPSAFERPGAARRNPGLAAMGAGSRRGFVELENGDPAARPGHSARGEWTRRPGEARERHASARSASQ